MTLKELLKAPYYMKNAVQEIGPPFRLRTWFHAARMRTLPLAFAVIALGSGLAYYHDKSSFKWSIFLLAVLTSFCYQVLSNYANDLGDGIKGTDADKQGEQRAVASGVISEKQMRNAVQFFTLLALSSGAFLSYLAFENVRLNVLFQSLNILAVWSARSYTLGKNPYAYWGGGDVFVFIFFGYVGVLGSVAIHTNAFYILDLLPASVAGAMSAAVLTLNNLRDIEGDKLHGKITLVVRFGYLWGRGYFKVLLMLSMILNLIFAIIATIESLHYYPLVAHILFQLLLRFIYKKFIAADSSKKLDALLKPTALVTLLYCVFTALSMVL